MDGSASTDTCSKLARTGSSVMTSDRTVCRMESSSTKRRTSCNQVVDGTSDHAGGQSEAVLADSTLNINVSFDGEGTAQISIVN